MLSLSGHLGAKVAALVDGQLAPATEERAWTHVLSCPGCRQLVEHERWTKQRLGLPVAACAPPTPPPSLLESLQAVDDWAALPPSEARGHGRRVGLVAVGGGAIAASVLGLVAVTGGAVVRGDVPPRPSPASIRGDLPQRGGGTVGTPSGAETNTSAVWTRRSR